MKKRYDHFKVKWNCFREIYARSICATAHSVTKKRLNAGELYPYNRRMAGRASGWMNERPIHLPGEWTRWSSSRWKEIRDTLYCRATPLLPYYYCYYKHTHAEITSPHYTRHADMQADTLERNRYVFTYV